MFIGKPPVNGVKGSGEPGPNFVKQTSETMNEDPEVQSSNIN